MRLMAGTTKVSDVRVIGLDTAREAVGRARRHLDLGQARVLSQMADVAREVA